MDKQPGRVSTLSRAEEPSVDDLIDRLVDITPRFEIQGEIARGAMGRILAGWDLHLGRPVAIKVLRRSTPRDLDRIRFLEEAQVTGQLQHPSVMPVYELGRLKGQVAFVMRRIEGRSLKEIIGRLQKKDPEVTEQFGFMRILQVFNQLCQAVAFAHSRGVVHRDLKPSNVMVGDFGEVVLLDWGLCKIISQQTRSSRSTSDRWRTVHGQIIGTPAYMAPEQAMGQIDQVDARTDVYGLGAILYHLLTLAPPFGGKSNREIIKKVLSETVPHPDVRSPDREVPTELSSLCMRCLARDPDERFEDARAIAAAIDELLASPRLTAPIRMTATEDETQSTEITAIHEAAGTDALFEISLAQGVAAINRQQSLYEDAALVADALLTSRAGTAPDDPPEAKEEAWRAEERLESLEADLAAAFADAMTTLTRALALRPNHSEARSMICDLFMTRYERAEARGDAAAIRYYTRLIEEYDDGRLASFVAGRGSLQVDIHPADATLRLSPLHEQARRLMPGTGQQLAGHPVVVRDLEAGRYIIQASAGGHEDLTTTLIVQPGQSTRLRLRMLPQAALPQGFVHIPAGTFRYGEARSSIWMPSEQALPDFLISTTPVTAEQYLEFVLAVARRAPEEARQRVPRTHDGRQPAWTTDRKGQWALPGADAPAGPWRPDIPVVGISAHDAAAYCQWLSEREGVRYRLPTEEEWEKAARGADGRHFPWGFHWEATYTAGPETWPGPWPPPVGFAPQDVSPYGVHDIAGAVREWTATLEPGRRTRVVARGGSFLVGGGGSRPVWARDVLPADRAAPDLGFRLARDISG